MTEGVFVFLPEELVTTAIPTFGHSGTIQDVL